MAKTAYCDQCASVISYVTQGATYSPLLQISGHLLNGEYCSLLCGGRAIEEERTKRIEQAGRT